MHAIALLRHGGVEQLRSHVLPIPRPGPGQLLLRVHAAGVGRWDILEREGVFALQRNRRTRFPHVGGSEGAGVVVATGIRAAGFEEGDRVYGLVAHRSPMAGFHAEFALVDTDYARLVPRRMSMDQAAVLPVDGGIALRGLRDILELQGGEALALFGASGGMGHLALQLAKRMGARVLAIASGEDGVRMASRLGADAAIDGRRDDIAVAMRQFAPGGLDAALLTAGGDGAAQVVRAMPRNARMAWPHGVVPPPETVDLPQARAYAAGYGPALMEDLHALVVQGPLMPHVSRRFPLERIAEAQHALGAHHLGRIAVSTL
ncbi:NADP-dependent oxidoreductase [Luteimonas aestuarii]|uniref:NADP-dependent oxidoreductase n=2 Tax=Luteimonas aestuarii TaxID=453837 RepID=A0A4R5TVM8_9GAMM|nr:NADP-dependent oxidoreductase [Luteimonas aestuarii]